MTVVYIDTSVALCTILDGPERPRTQAWVDATDPIVIATHDDTVKRVAVELDLRVVDLGNDALVTHKPTI